MKPIHKKANPSKKIWKKLFQPPCLGNDSLKILDCIAKFYEHGHTFPCNYYAKCISAGLKRLKYQTRKMEKKSEEAYKNAKKKA
jgi:hypothetical protein